MPLYGTVQIDAFTYDVGAVDEPLPDGSTQHIHLLAIADGPLQLLIRFSEADWRAFAERVSASRIEIARTIPHGANGHGG